MISINSFADLSEAAWGYFENPIRCAILPDGSNCSETSIHFHEFARFV